ncbi:uncharacterized protein BX664DRAFT_342841 [Halteromyces radiatus]|uniref:uncharacterized protein n=1 Tax=Halteromyces radiatus TaxID=101107 RepID=UPI00221E4EB1|nr:uncharacterized protein BX664DRAFT_342841 [Halteromyces radiatus]KAI8078840.1 hypothetical protein BX664DRAFT_342841 [Halteromyces radiatus]
MTNVDVMNSSMTEISTFTPSLGLRYWMNKMKRTSTPQEEINKLPETSSTKGNTDIGNKQSTNDTQSAVSISGITTSSYFGIGSVHGGDIDSSLRVHHQCASSERSSFLSDDIQSNASIKSKPWISKLVNTSVNSPTTFPDANSSITKDTSNDDKEDDDDINDESSSSVQSIEASTTEPSTTEPSTTQTRNTTATTTTNDTKERRGSKQNASQRQWTENELPPRPLGRIKAGLGRLIGREHSSTTSSSDHHGTVL